MGRKIRVDGRLYEEVRPSGRKRSVGRPRSLREALDWDMFSRAEKEEICDGLMSYITDVRNILVNEDCESAESFFDSVRMRMTYWDINFGYETVRVGVEVDDDYYEEISVIGDIPDGESNGQYVGEGMLGVWKKWLPKIKKMAKQYIGYVGDRDVFDFYADPKCDRLMEDLLDAVEGAKEALVNVVEDDIQAEIEWIGSDEWFDEEISSGNDFIRDYLDDYLLNREDSEYADNESVRLVREATSRGKSKKGPRKFYVGEVIDDRTPRGEGLCYEVVARTQRTVTFHVTGDDDNYNGPDGTVDDELTCKINRNTVNRNESAFVHYGMVAYA